MIGEYKYFNSTSQILTSLNLWVDGQDEIGQINLGEYILRSLCFFPKFGHDLSKFVLIKNILTGKIGLAFIMGSSYEQMQKIFRSGSSYQYEDEYLDLRNVKHRIICEPIYDDIDILFSDNRYAIITKIESRQGILFFNELSTNPKPIWFKSIEHDYQLIICDDNLRNLVFNIDGEQLFQCVFQALTFIGHPLYYDFIFNYKIINDKKYLLGNDCQNRYIVGLDGNISKSFLSDGLLYIGNDCFLRSLSDHSDIIYKDGRVLCESVKGSFIFLLDDTHYLSKQDNNYCIYDFSGHLVKGRLDRIYKLTKSLIFAKCETEYSLQKPNGELIVSDKDFMTITREFWRLNNLPS